MDAHIVVDKLGKRFVNDTQELVAYQDISFQVAQGELYCIVGPSGCGKTTLLRTIAGLETPSGGSLQIHAKQNNRVQIGMVFQGQGLFPWMSVYANIAFLLSNNPKFNKSDISRITSDYLNKVGLTGFAQLYPHQLSGGMRQRVSIARSFATDPEILLMDEPFVFLDYQTRQTLQELLLELWQQTNKTIVFVTHDIEEAVLLADRIMVMTAHPGRIKRIIVNEISRPRDVVTVRKQAPYLRHVDEVAKLVREEIVAAQ
jgi:NitT/TauT family transport system ATP-binding protein